MKIYLDQKAEVKIGDKVRYIKYRWDTRKFYMKTGTVTEFRGTGGIGIHFPHYAAGTNLITAAENVRLVT